MYLDYFGLKRDPFTISPDPAFLYPSPQHRQALAHLKYGLDREGGFILLTGEVGTGKTTLTRLLLEQLPGNIRVAYILNAKLDSQDALASICSELGLAYSPDDSIKALTDLINRDLLAAHSQGKKTLVVIEEAQNLDPDVLEMLRLLTNLETNTAKLAHILLVGQPELLDLIARNELRQLNQRVVSRFHLEPLDLQETANYLAHRLHRSGCSRALFDSGAIRAMHRLSGGVPRVLNLLAERSLLGAYATNKKQVSVSVVKAASEEVFGARTTTTASDFKKRSLIAASLLAVCVVGLGAFLLAGQKPVLLESALVSTPVNTDHGEGSEPPSAEQVVTILTEQTLDIEKDHLIDIDGQANSQMELNAYEQLLDVWGISASVASQTSLCSAADQSGLSCQQDSALQLPELFEINRPGLVRIAPSNESQHLYMLSELNDSELLLSNSQGIRRLPPDEFERQWDGEFIYLWPTPAGYKGLVAPGTENPELVSWVQQQLVDILDGYEYIYNGGVYSPLIADSVAEFQTSQGLKADGLLGPRTLLRLMEQTQGLPALGTRQDQTDPLASGTN